MFAERPLRLAPIAHAHLAGVMAVQALAYGDALLESPEVLGSKLRIPGDTCWGAFAAPSAPAAAPAGAPFGSTLGEGGRAPLPGGGVSRTDAQALCAYAIAHAVPQGAPLALNKAVEPVPPQRGDWLYVHDIAVDPAWAGHGLAARLLAEVLDAGRRLSFSRAMLVAVQGADVYWARHGFVTQAAPMAMLGFGEGAVWMVRDL